MSVEFHAGRWSIRYRPKGRKGPFKRLYLPEEITTREEALAIDRDYARRRRKKDPDSLPPSYQLVEDLWIRYVREWVAVQLMPTTARDIEGAARLHLLPHFGLIPIGDLDTAHVTEYIQKRKTSPKLSRNGKDPTSQTLSNRSINKELSYFSGFLTWCTNEAKITFDRPRVPTLPTRRPLPLVLTVEEISRLLAAAEPLYRAYLGTLYLMGLRDATAKGLCCEHIDWERGFAVITQKGGQQQVKPVPPWLLECLTAIKPASGKGPIFINPHTKRTIVDPRHAIDRACKAAGIVKRVYPHLLRHTCATHLLELNENLRFIQEILGHTRVETTEWYTHVAAESLRITSNALEQNLLRNTVPTPKTEAGQAPPPDAANGVAPN